VRMLLVQFPCSAKRHKKEDDCFLVHGRVDYSHYARGKYLRHASQTDRLLRASVENVACGKSESWSPDRALREETDKYSSVISFSTLDNYVAVHSRRSSK